ncbi:MAG: phosphatase PAP2 family protein [Erysipelotrichaceae bacterium]|nr:phosphatase PAP2 family protein [Erysipelotrichaceae bacterium]
MTITSIDFAILDWIQETLRCGFLDFLMPVITYLGSVSVFYIFVALIMLTKEKYRNTAIILLVSIAAGYVLGNLILKNVIARSRPFWIREGMEIIVKKPTDYSFPSGHTVSATVSAMVLLIRHHKLGFFAMILSSLIAFSRLYLYVHFPSDVLGGIILGIITAATVNKIMAGKLEGNEA